MNAADHHKIVRLQARADYAQATVKWAKLHRARRDRAISSDDEAGLKKSIENYTSGPLPLPLAADPSLETFKAYRCYDDFEKQPLHGTFVLDASGRIRWQDISYEPFMDPNFVLTEAQRLLALP